MTTTADVIAEARDYLLTGQRDVLNQLQTGIDADDIALTLKRDLKGVTTNGMLSIDLEDIHVWAPSGASAGSTVDVLRAQNGSTGAAHSADALVYVNTQYSPWRVLRAINEELKALSGAGLWRVKNVNLTYAATQMGYDLTGTGSDFLDVWRVRMDTVGPEQDWPLLRRDEWRLDQHSDTTDFPSGRSLVLYRGTTPGRTVKVSYKASFGQLSALADNVESVSGLHTEAMDLLAIGATIRLISGREIKRSSMEAQPEPRRADEVPAGAAMGAIRPMMALREQRLREERNRLHQRYPLGVG
jgi:hypothetical protein